MDGPFDLSGRRALVIGAGAPVGSAIALALAEAGADVAVATASLAGEEVMAARRVRRRIVALGRRSAEYAFDVTLGQNVQVSTRQVAKELGGLEIVVYAVDARLHKPIEQVSEADWQRVLNLNLSGAFYASRAAVRELRGATDGRIIIVSSGLGERGLAGAVAYSAARHGVTGLVRALAQEVAPAGIGVNAIAPLWLAGDAGVGPDSEENPLVRYLPLRRLGQPSEVAPLAVYLASAASGFVTGQVFTVDGGALARL